MELSQTAGSEAREGPALDLDAELARLAALPLEERGPGLDELARRLEAELDATAAPLQDPEQPA